MYLCFSENEALWREVASLRQKHVQQQKVVNKVRTRDTQVGLSMVHTRGVSDTRAKSEQDAPPFKKTAALLPAPLTCSAQALGFFVYTL